MRISGGPIRSGLWAHTGHFLRNNAGLTPREWKAVLALGGLWLLGTLVRHAGLLGVTAE